LIVLRDEAGGVEAAVAPEKGGELSGYKVRHGGEWIELLHRARDYSEQPGWRGKAPVLFPATGGTYPRAFSPAGAGAEGIWEYQGKQLRMPFHGFVQNMPWKVESRGADSRAARLRLSVGDTARTRAWYPFGFLLSVEYVVQEGGASLNYAVRAAKQNTDEMFFSIGNHITFRAPFLKGTDAADIIFDTPSTVEYVKDDRNMPTGESRPRTFRKVRLGEIPALRAISLGGYAGDPFMTLKDPAGLTLRMSHRASAWPPSPVLQFNLYGSTKDGFFSPEPWVGLQNSFNLRKGLVMLAPGAEWTWRIQLSTEPRR
jgi:galactose mutarotase-like enzyme